jgi:hypothetical protein
MTNHERQSPFKEWWHETLGDWFDLKRYWSERQKVLKAPGECLSNRPPGVESGPVSFAIKSIVLIAVVVSAVDWVLTYFADLPPSLNDRLWDHLPVSELADNGTDTECLSDTLGRLMTEGAKRTELGFLEKLQDLINNLEIFFQSLGIVLASMLFQWSFHRSSDKYPNAVNADRVYLYYVTARLFFPNALFAFSTFLTITMSRFVSLNDFESTSSSALPTPFLFGAFVLGVLQSAAIIWATCALVVSSSRLVDVFVPEKQRQGREIFRKLSVFFRLAFSVYFAGILVNFIQGAGVLAYLLLRLVISEIMSDTPCLF